MHIQSMPQGRVLGELGQERESSDLASLMEQVVRLENRQKAAGQDFLAAEQSIARAARLRPDDDELADLHRHVTVASRRPPVPFMDARMKKLYAAHKVNYRRKGNANLYWRI